MAHDLAAESQLDLKVSKWVQLFRTVPQKQDSISGTNDSREKRLRKTLLNTD